MDDQRLIPDAFLAVYRDARGRLSESRDTLLARHEWCEDLCQMLAERVQWLHQDHGVDAAELAARVVNSLPDAEGLHAGERDWVQARLAELLNG